MLKTIRKNDVLVDLKFIRDIYIYSFTIEQIQFLKLIFLIVTKVPNTKVRQFQYYLGSSSLQIHEIVV